MIEAMKAAGCRDWTTAIRHVGLIEARQAAFSFRGVRMIIMGDDGEFWVVSHRDAGVLRKAGYETI
jgi:hypothetical protein